MMKRSGFGLGTFYLYYKDKKDLEEKIVSDIFTDLVLNGEKKVEGIEDNKDRYIAFMSYIIDELIKDPLKLELISKNTNRALYAKVENDARFKEADTTLKFLLTRYDSMFPKKLSEEEQLYILFLTVQILLITCKASFEKDSVLTIEEMKPVLFRIVEKILGSYPLYQGIFFIVSMSLSTSSKVLKVERDTRTIPLTSVAMAL